MVLSSSATCEQLLDEASRLPVTGWDFSVLGERLHSSALAVGYERHVAEAARGARSMLDLGTGGGEWLAAFAARPPRTVAAEAWPPNVTVVRRRLAPLGIEVVQVASAPDNADADEEVGRLPFADAAFDLVCARHESFAAPEVARILAPGCAFITQQSRSPWPAAMPARHRSTRWAR